MAYTLLGKRQVRTLKVVENWNTQLMKISTKLDKDLTKTEKNTNEPPHDKTNKRLCAQ